MSGEKKPKRPEWRRGTKGNRGGGRKKGSIVVQGGRAFARSLVDDPANRELVTEAFGRALRSEDAIDAITAFVKIFDHAYGRPPQALDIRTPKADGETTVYRAVVAGLDSAEFEDLPGSDVPLGSTH